MVPRRGQDGVRRVITDKAWRQLEPVLARTLSPRGVPPKLGPREFLEAVLHLDRTGVPWRDLPPAFGAWDAVYRRFLRWERNGTWAALWRELQAPARRLFVDSTVIRAHQHAAGGPGDARDRSLGRSRGGWGTKIHLAACDERTALGVVLTAGQAGDAPGFAPTLCDVLGETAATAVMADRSYDSDAIRADLADAGFEVVIPARRNLVDPPPHDAEVYKEREKD